LDRLVKETESEGERHSLHCLFNKAEQNFCW